MRKPLDKNPMFNGKNGHFEWKKNNDPRENMRTIWTTGQPMVSFEKNAGLSTSMPVYRVKIFSGTYDYWSTSNPIADWRLSLTVDLGEDVMIQWGHRSSRSIVPKKPWLLRVELWSKLRNLLCWNSSFIWFMSFYVPLHIYTKSTYIDIVWYRYK